MSDNQPPEITLALYLLRKEGWTCSPPAGPLLAPCEIADLIGLKPNSLHRRLHSPSCPPFYAEITDTGRIIQIRLTQDLEAYLRRPLLRGTARR